MKLGDNFIVNKFKNGRIDYLWNVYMEHLDGSLQTVTKIDERRDYVRGDSGFWFSKEWCTPKTKFKFLQKC